MSKSNKNKKLVVMALKNKNNGKAMRALAPNSSPFGNELLVPAAIAQAVKYDKPVINKTKIGAVNVKHRELFKSIGTTGGDVDLYSAEINPGLEEMFPWLHAIAINFESYRFRKLRVYVLSTRSTSTSGSYIMAFDYDVLDPPAASYEQLAGYDGAVRCQVWQGTYIEADSAAMHAIGPKKYVRALVPDGDLDLKTYDVGTFQLIVHSTTTAMNVLECWVEYDIDFFTPQWRPNLEAITAQQSLLSVDAAGNTNQIVTDAVPYYGKLPFSLIDMNVENPAKYGEGFLFHKPGLYGIDYFIDGPAPGVAGPTIDGAHSVVDVWKSISSGTDYVLKLAVKVKDIIYTVADSYNAFGQLMGTFQDAGAYHQVGTDWTNTYAGNNAHIYRELFIGGLGDTPLDAIGYEYHDTERDFTYREIDMRPKHLRITPYVPLKLHLPLAQRKILVAQGLIAANTWPSAVRPSLK